MQAQIQSESAALLGLHTRTLMQAGKLTAYLSAIDAAKMAFQAFPSLRAEGTNALAT